MQNSNLRANLFCQIDHNNLNEVYLLESQQITNESINSIVRTKNIQIIVDYSQTYLNIDDHFMLIQFKSIKMTIKEIQVSKYYGKTFNILFIPKKDDTFEVYKLLAVYCILEQKEYPLIIKIGLKQWGLENECFGIVEDISVDQRNYSTEQSQGQNQINQAFYQENNQRVSQDNFMPQQEISQTNQTNFKFPQLKPIGFRVSGNYGNQLSSN